MPRRMRSRTRSSCCTALRCARSRFASDDARSAVERALRYKAQTFRGKVGPNELVIPAIRGLEGSLIYLVDRGGPKRHDL